MDIKVNYFDLGLFDGSEIKMMLEIFGSLNITNYNIWGFEAHPIYAGNCSRSFVKNPKIRIINNAISFKDGSSPLYISSNAEGHSIYSSKNNVSPSKSIKVNCIRLSEWIKANVSDFGTSFNILKANIEGAEWDLLRDLEQNKLFNSFHVYCGAWGDVYKVAELKPIVPLYESIIKSNNMTLHRFSYWKPERNADMRKIIRNGLEGLCRQNV